MTVSEELYLSDKPSLFKEHFDSAIERILDCKEDQSFWFLLVCLVQKLSVHPLVSSDLQRFEQEIKQQEEECNQANLKLLEGHWDKLWRYHRSLKHRKQLVRIKWMSMLLHSMAPLSAYQHAIFAIQEFICSSPFCFLLKKMPQLFQRALIERCSISDQFETSDDIDKPPRIIKISLLKLAKKDKRINFHEKIFYRQISVKARAERVYLDLIVSPVTKLCSHEERYKGLQSMVELSPAVCWSRMRFLERCYTAQELPFFKGFKGRWDIVREKMCQAALERSNALVFLEVKKALRQSFGGVSFARIGFLIQEYQIYRKDYEYYLHQLDWYLKDILARKESEVIPVVTSSVTPKFFTRPQQKEAEVEILAKQFWDNNPLAQHEEAYNDYCKNSRLKKPYKFDTWVRIIRKKGLDPRPSDKKTRGKGKKE